MRYQSTRSAEQADLVDAIMRGLAADGGLFVPTEWPAFQPGAVIGTSLAEIGAQLLQPFFEGSRLADALPDICRETFDFPLPLVPVIEGNDELAVLELFHGPTAAFKDFGARFLAATMERALRATRDARPLTILVATSGDTGGAVAAAFEGRAGIRVGMLVPERSGIDAAAATAHVLGRQRARVRNRRHLRRVPSAREGRVRRSRAAKPPPLSSAANSINIGRLLPQVGYHAAASLWHWREHGDGGRHDRPDRQSRQRGGMRLGARRSACQFARSCSP